MKAHGSPRAPLACITCALAALGVCACANNYDRMEPRVSETTTTAATAPRATANPTVPRPIVVEDTPAPATMMPVREWEARYPFPASELTRWAKSHREAAAALAAWEGKDTEKSRVLIQWAIGHPYEELGTFLINRPGWDEFSDIRARYPEAIDSLIEWARHSNRAAEELVTRSSGFSSLVARGDGNTV
jgi:hypothetical protein